MKRQLTTAILFLSTSIILSSCSTVVPTPIEQEWEGYGDVEPSGEVIETQNGSFEAVRIKANEALLQMNKEDISPEVYAQYDYSEKDVEELQNFVLDFFMQTQVNSPLTGISYSRDSWLQVASPLVEKYVLESEQQRWLTSDNRNLLDNNLIFESWINSNPTVWSPYSDTFVNDLKSDGTPRVSCVKINENLNIQPYVLDNTNEISTDYSSKDIVFTFEGWIVYPLSDEAIIKNVQESLLPPDGTSAEDWDNQMRETLQPELFDYEGYNNLPVSFMVRYSVEQTSEGPKLVDWFASSIPTLSVFLKEEQGGEPNLSNEICVD